MNRSFPAAFGNRKSDNTSAPRTNSSMWRNKYQNEEKAAEAARLAEVARRTEFNEINFPSLGGSMIEQGWGGEEKPEPVVHQSGNKWSELAADWKIHDIVEKQYAEIKKEADERKKNEFGRIIPKVYIENKTLGTTHSKHEDTYEEDPYYDSPPVSRNDGDIDEDEGWTTVSSKPKKVKAKRKPVMMDCDPVYEPPASIWENDEGY